MMNGSCTLAVSAGNPVASTPRRWPAVRGSVRERECAQGYSVSVATPKTSVGLYLSGLEWLGPYA